MSRRPKNNAVCPSSVVSFNNYDELPSLSKAFTTQPSVRAGLLIKISKMFRMCGVDRLMYRPAYFHNLLNLSLIIALQVTSANMVMTDTFLSVFYPFR